MKIFNQALQLLDYPNLGKLILRVAFSLLMLMHGLHKMGDLSGIEAMLAAKNLPAFIAYGVYIGEIIAPIFLILGIYTRLFALILAFNMLTAALLVNTGFLSVVPATGAWGLESIAVFFFAALALVFLGGGRFAITQD